MEEAMLVDVAPVRAFQPPDGRGKARADLRVILLPADRVERRQLHPVPLPVEEFRDQIAHGVGGHREGRVHAKARGRDHRLHLAHAANNVDDGLYGGARISHAGPLLLLPVGAAVLAVGAAQALLLSAAALIRRRLLAGSAGSALVGWRALAGWWRWSRGDQVDGRGTAGITRLRLHAARRHLERFVGLP